MKTTSENMLLGPYWATYGWTSELDIPDLVSLYDTIRLASQVWQVSLA